jgi:uncharacterized protein YvpB
MINYGFIPSKIDGTELEFKTKNIELPKTISYKKYLPPVINQGADPICVPCSISSYINWMINLEDGANNRDNGVNYKMIYNHRSNEDNDGMTFKDAFKFLRHNCVELKNGCENTIERYAKVNSELQLKQALVMNGPCVGGLPVYDTYKSNFWKKEKEEKVQGLHAVAIVGYTKEGFIIRNSWGRFYGDGGYAILPYDDFKNFTEIWTII